MVNGGSGSLVNSTVAANSASVLGGGMVVSNSASFSVLDSTISNNSSAGGSGSGGGVLVGGATVTLDNSIVANSTNGDCVQSDGTINAQSSLIEDGLTCINGTNINNLTGDPSLGTFTGVYYPLNADSIAIDAGDVVLVPVDLTTDEAGNPRIQGAAVDLGAYETYEAPIIVILSPTSATIAEGSSADFTITRAGSTTKAMTVMVDISLGTGTTTGDYSFSGGLTGSLTGTQPVIIPAGQAAVTVRVNALADAVGAEPDNTLTIALASEPNYDFGATSSATVTIPANDLTVTNLNDSGEGSLRQAIANANAFSSDDTITFTTSGTITLTSGQLTLANNGTLTIDGGGAVTVDGNAADRVFTVATGAHATLDGLTITNGSASGDGGGLYNGGTLTVTNSTISGNSATNYGGGLYNGGTLTATNSTISGNSAANVGGGLYNSGTLTVTNSTISGNSAVYFDGGGIYNSGTLTVTNSTISGNSVDGYGGGLYNGGRLTVTNSTLFGNSAIRGSGIYNGGRLTVTNSTISGNSASSDGGGLYNASSGTITLNNSTVSGNSTSGGGGGLYNASSGTITLNNSTVSGNSATLAGGGIRNERSGGTITLKNSIVANSPSGGDCTRVYGTITAQNSLIKAGLTCVTNNLGGNLTGDPDLGTLTGSPAYYPLNSTSPAIDAGDNALVPPGITTDEAGNPRIQGAAVDMGAYESLYIPPVTQIVFGQQPNDSLVNQTISPAVTVRLEDVNGNLVTTASDSVSLVINNNPGGGNLNGTTTVSAVNGVATFSDLSIDAAGTGYTLDASVIGLTNVTSNSFNITAATIPVAIDHTSPYLVITDPGNLVAEGASIGDRFAFSLTQAPTADVTVTFTSSDSSQLEIIDPTVRGRYAPVGSYTVIFSASGAHGAHTVPWNSPVVINLYGVPDAVAEGAQTYAIQFTLTSSDPVYNNLAVPDESVTVYDAGVSNSPTSPTLPKGGSGSYTIVLDAPPGFLALTTALGGNQDEKVTVTANGVDHIFTRANWNVPQTVPVTVPDDGVCTGDYDLPIGEAVTSNINLNPYMDLGYGGPNAPAPNVIAPAEIIHVTDPYCTTGAQVNREPPPVLNGAAPNAISPGGTSAPQGGGELPPSVEAPGAP